MPTIGIDCRFGSVLGGLGSYTRGLVSALLQRDDPWETTLFVKDRNEAWLRDLSQTRVRYVEAPFDHYSFAEQIQFPNVLQDAACDLLLFPHFNVPLWCESPFICTVHDLILHQFPNKSSFLRRFAYRFTVSQALRRAHAVSVVSAYTQKEVGEVYGKRILAKTSVIYPGIGAGFARQSDKAQKTVRQKHGLLSPYFIYIGNAKEHKNVSVLLDAFRETHLAGIELVLVTGGREIAHLQRTQGVRFLGGLSDDELPALLSGALACVTATLMEGFCLPLVEAMACGTPVIATNVGPIPEVTGGHALLCEPTKESLMNALRIAVIKKSTQKSLDAGVTWAKQYSWETAAEKTAARIEKTCTDSCSSVL